MAPVVALPTLRSHPRCPPPPLGLARRVLPTGTVVWSVPHPLSAASPRCRFVLKGGGRCPPLPTFIPHPWGGGGVCVGGGGLSTSLRCTHVAGTTQARRRHGARHLSLCRGGGMPGGSRRRPSYPAFAPLVVPPLGLARRVLSTGMVVWSVPHPLAAASPPCRFVLGGGGRFSPPPTCIPHPWGGGGVCGGGGAPLMSSLRSTHVAGTTQAWRRHEARHLSLCRGGGLPCVTRRRPSYPACAPPGGAEVCWGGGGLSSSLRCTHVAGTTQARRKHGVRHLAAAGGGGVSPLGLPALLHGIRSAPQDLQPLLPLGGSRHVSAWCSVSRACSLLCPYLLEEVRTRVETEDEEVPVAGRTYRTPRRLLAPSAALVEGRAPVSAPNSPGGDDCPSSPWCLCIHFRAA